MPFTAVTVVIRAHLALLSSKYRSSMRGTPMAMQNPLLNHGGNNGLIIACAREPPFNKDKAHICSRHFTSACLMPVGGKNRLFYNRCAHMRQAHYKNCLQ